MTGARRTKPVPRRHREPPVRAATPKAGGASARAVITTLVGAGVVLGAIAAQPKPAELRLDDGWRDVSLLLTRDAATAFQEAADDAGLPAQSRREAELGLALCALDSTSAGSRRGEARSRLESLVRECGDDDLGISARYLLGRMQQQDSGGSGLGDAPGLLELLRDHPGHRLAQLGAVKLALHRLYRRDVDDAARIAGAEALGAAIHIPELRRDFHLLLADACLFFGDRQREALRHLLAARDLGIPDPAKRATVLVQIGELARLSANNGLAAESYRQFLSEFRRDIRILAVRERLEALGGHEQP